MENASGVAFRVHGIEIDPCAREYAGALARVALDEVSQPVGLLSTDGAVLEYNLAALARCGLTRKEATGRPFWEAMLWKMTPSTQEDLREAVARAARGERIRYEVETSSRLDGTESAAEFTLRPVRDEQGHVVFILVEGREIPTPTQNRS